MGNSPKTDSALAGGSLEDPQHRVASDLAAGPEEGQGEQVERVERLEAQAQQDPREQ
ncbi:MAG: hypothetical protein ACTHQ3_16210 [Motilibacteraceae bacterium]